MVVFWLILGLVILTLGAEFLVKGASKLAVIAGISPLVVGLTVVAFGTSAPELVVSVQATLAGQSDIAIGNVVGSNILNVLFILGISALIVPLRVASQLIRFDVPLMALLSVIVYVMARDKAIGMIDGILLFAGILAYTFWTIIQSRREQKEIQQEYEGEYGVKEKQTAASILTNIVMLAAGLGMLILGAQWLVDSAIIIAKHLGVSELVIGLTIIALGTSLPEVATSIVAAIRGERDIAVGNVVGSNIFNIACVLGLCGMLGQTGVAVSDKALSFDIPIMIAVAVLCIPTFYTGYTITRWNGMMFLVAYALYTIYLILDATDSPSKEMFGKVALWGAIPLGIAILLVDLVRDRQTKHNPGKIA